ncbi:MAG: SusC/RagA family TonB-linked outer membrane protein [Candidatus Pseudobacter hemicellulosilyticus]|uniref:SusC/RagA family TonB-linked outer membrane protein n=1 Tax=Candidatus Pseudobacter hemicellulosilyticus TaxID=3121375 RepID=A0AAJ5WVE9_9BACT|nr:MAG: SusC/RagA family TonB-linked outer membrane protein [Pseudobacter sp.]
MRWTAFFLLAGCLQAAASGKAQQVNLSRNQVSLKSVFRDIGKQTGYTFFYNPRLLEGTEPVSLSLEKVSLEEALKAALNNQPLTYSIVNRTVVIKAKPPVAPTIPMVVDETVTIKGKVLDENGSPLLGASIIIKGNASGTSTNNEGEFTISVASGTVLVVSYIGFEPHEFTARKTGQVVIRLKLRSLKDSMNNVVVTGYNTIRRESFTGTAVTVTGEDLKMVNPQNMLRSLQVFDPSFRIADNVLAGSNPNMLPNITVRGSTALPGNSTDIISRSNLGGMTNLPTFIMDGYEVTLQKVFDLDMNRVQSVTLLKDAAATAIYGSRAANGVVVIVTKPPKRGKLQVNYNYELNLQTPDLTEYDLLDATRKLEYERMAGVYDNSKNISMSQDQLDQLYYHHLEKALGGVNTYWLSQPLKSAYGQKHSLYVEGGDQAFRYGLEMRYQTMPGVMKGSTRDRLSTGLNLSYNVGSKFQFRNQIMITQMKAKESPYGSFSNYARMNPYFPKTDSAGRTVQVIDLWRQTASSGTQSIVPVLNPLYDASLGSFDKSDYLELIDAFSAEWSILPSLRFRGLASINKTKTTGDFFRSPNANYYYDYGADRINERGYYRFTTTDETFFDGNATLTFNQQLGGHFINAMLGSNMRTYFSQYREVSAVGFTNDRFTDIGFAVGYGEDARPYSHRSRERLVGAFVSVNYSFRNRYLMDFTYRQDGSSKFGDDKKIAPFSAFGIGWNLHQEAFMQGSVLSRLKIRASTGATGSVSFDSYMATPTYNYFTGNQYSTGLGAIVNNYGNTSLEWQKTTNYDLGMEIGLLKDRIVLMPRYYYKLTKGLLADITLPPSTGFGSYKENLGDMRNIGYELSIQANLIRARNFNLNLNANFSRNTNTLVKISNSLKNYNDMVDKEQSSDDYKGTPLLRYNEGQSLQTIYGVRSLGIDPENGRELYVKRDGTLTYDWDSRDIVPVGNSAPEAEGSFGLFTSYKQFSLNLNFQTRFGGDMYNQTLVDRVENADPRFNVDSRVFEEKWKQRGDHTFYKNIADLGTTEVVSRFVMPDNLIELQSLYFSYDVNQQLLSRTPVRYLRASFTMNDVWRWSSVKQERGIDYPYARSFTFSIQAGF